MTLLQSITEVDGAGGGGAFLFRRGRDADAWVAGEGEANEVFGVGLEGFCALWQIEPLFQDRVLAQGGELGEEGGLVFVEGADEHALPRFALSGEEEGMQAVEHEGAAAEPRF